MSEPAVRKRPGPKPGTRPSGRQKGTRNKKTIAALEKEQTRAQILAELREEAKAEGRDALRRAKDVMEEFLPVVRGITAYFQPTFPGMPVQNPTGNKKEFLMWFGEVLLPLAKALAPYQSPTFRAIDMRATMPRANEVDPMDIMRALLDEIDEESRAERAQAKQLGLPAPEDEKRRA